MKRPLLPAVIALGAALVWLLARSDTETASPSTRATIGEPTAEPQRIPRVRAAETDTPGPDAAERPADAAQPTAAAGVARVLRIVDGAGDPVRGITVSSYEPDGTYLNTKENGEVAFPASAHVRSATFFDGIEDRVVELKEPRTEAVVTAFPRAEAEVIDGATGERLTGVGVTIRPYRPRGFAAVAGQPGPTVGVDSDGEVGFWGAFEPPRGYGAVERPAWDSRVAVGVARIRLVAVAYPEFTVRLVATGEDGRPVAGAKAVEALFEQGENEFIAPEPVTCRSEPSGADGVVTARLPSIPGRTFAVCVATDLPPGEEAAPDELLVGVVSRVTGGGAAVPVTLRRGTMPGRTRYGSTSCRGLMSQHDPEGSAPIVVRVVHADGRPARRVGVRGPGCSGHTGADGTVKFEKAERGEGVFTAGARGFLPAAVAATVGRDEEVTIREAEPRRVVVTVTDDAGRALPAAWVSASIDTIQGPNGDVYAYAEIAQLDGDCEVLNPHTGRDGTITLEAPRGVVRYEARYGPARASVKSAADAVAILITRPVPPPESK